MMGMRASLALESLSSLPPPINFGTADEWNEKFMRQIAARYASCGSLLITSVQTSKMSLECSPVARSYFRRVMDDVDFVLVQK